MRALVRRRCALGAHQLEHLALPVAHEPLDVGPQVGRRLGEVGVRREELAPAGQPAPGAGASRTAAVSALDSDSAATPRLQGLAEVVGRRRVALDGGGDLVAPAGDA